MPPDDDGGLAGDHAERASVFLRIAWLWLLRYIAVLVVVVVMIATAVQDLSPLLLLLIGFVLGVIFDRLILWPLAVLVARLDGRIRPR